MEATTRGLVAHGMHGFDYVKARLDLEIPDSFDVMAMVAIGELGQRKTCQCTYRKRRDQNGIKPMIKIVIEGRFMDK